MPEDLMEALDSLKSYRMTAADVEAQRVSFVYGNGSSDDNDTKESVKKAIENAEMS